MIQECNRHWQYQDTGTNLIMPWFTLPALQWLINQDLKNWNVFEYGAGYSTIWLRVKCNSVKSVDSTKQWAIVANCVWTELEDSYIKQIDSGRIKKYDCIIVDGEWRRSCVEYSRDFLESGKYMIVDNYSQTDFPAAEEIDKLLEGWEKQVFKQPNHTEWATAVFKKP